MHRKHNETAVCSRYFSMFCLYQLDKSHCSTGRKWEVTRGRHDERFSDLMWNMNTRIWLVSNQKMTPPNTDTLTLWSCNSSCKLIQVVGYYKTRYWTDDRNKVYKNNQAHSKTSKNQRRDSVWTSHVNLLIAIKEIITKISRIHPLSSPQLD